ncbi:MAG: ABC transporter ATP-binding protein [Oscillospiraceae bacterium]
MKKFFDKIAKFLRILAKTIFLLWESSPAIFTIIFFLSLFSGLMMPANLWIWKGFIDTLSSVLLNQTNSTFHMLFGWLGLHFIINLLMNLSGNVLNYYQNLYSEYLNKTITDKTISKILNIELKDFDNAETYNKIQKSNDESFSRSLSIMNTMVQLTKNIASLLGIVGILIKFNTPVVIFCILSSVPIFYLSCKILNKWFDIFNERFENTRFIKSLKTMLIKNENIKEIKLYNIGKYIKKTIINLYDVYLNSNKKIRKKFLFETSGIDAIDMCLSYTIKCFVILASINKKLSIGHITMYISSIDNLKSSISNILSLFSTAYEDSLYMQSVFSLLEIKVENQKGKIKFNGLFKTIEFNDVSFCYPDTIEYVLQEFNMIFNANHTYALVGLNGSGKTTLIKLLLNLYQPIKGNILIDGVNINEYDRDSLYDYTSAVFQDYVKYPFDVKTNIGLGDIREIDNMDLIRKAAQSSGADTFINQLPQNYSTKLQKEWSGSVDLSIGQWQKLAISRSLMKQSAILILDEPSASLDALAEYEIFKKYKGMKEKKLCILVTHRLTCASIADEIIVLESGKLIEKGTHDQLIKHNGTYSTLYNIQRQSYTK